MGLGQTFLTDLIELKNCGALDGCKRIIEIGAQQLADSFLESSDQLSAVYRLFGRAPTDLGKPVGANNFAKEAPPAREFWQSLGLDYATIDYADADAVTLDLNRDTVPDNWGGQFDLVINAGTTEHVVNQDNAFAVVHALAKNGAVMYHEVPACMFGHGLVNYSPKFFIQLLRQNAYDPLFIRLCKSDDDPLPAYIKAMNRRWGRGHKLDFETTQTFMIRAALRKTGNNNFVTPLDLPRTAAFKEHLRTPIRGWKNLLPLR